MPGFEQRRAKMLRSFNGRCSAAALILCAELVISIPRPEEKKGAVAPCRVAVIGAGICGASFSYASGPRADWEFDI